MFQALDILRRGVASSIGRLIKGTVYAQHSAHHRRAHVGLIRHTVAVHGAMGARLLAIALDLFPSAFVARPSHPSPLLEMRRVLHGRRILVCAVEVRRWRGLRQLLFEVVLLVVDRLAAVGVLLGRGLIHHRRSARTAG